MQTVLMLGTLWAGRVTNGDDRATLCSGTVLLAVL